MDMRYKVFLASTGEPVAYVNSLDALITLLAYGDFDTERHAVKDERTGAIL